MQNVLQNRNDVHIAKIMRFSPKCKVLSDFIFKEDHIRDNKWCEMKSGMNFLQIFFMKYIFTHATILPGWIFIPKIGFLFLYHFYVFMGFLIQQSTVMMMCLCQRRLMLCALNVLFIRKFEKKLWLKDDVLYLVFWWKRKAHKYLEIK